MAVVAVPSVGLKEWGIAPTNISRCGVCGLPCLKGKLRYVYRFKASTKIGDEKRVHPECLAKLPLVEADVQLLTMWSVADDVESSIRDSMNGTLVSLLNPPMAASSSG